MSSEPGAVPNDQASKPLDQGRLLEYGKNKVKEFQFYMKRAMASKDLKAVLSHATDMLRELRTGALQPKNYYDLYMLVLDQLRELEDYFTYGVEIPIVELYEMVQSCGNVLPRLYLLITVAGIYIKSKEAPAVDILKDLIEMTKGVQHPLRGLFLRNYLSQVTRDKLPDVDTEFYGEGGTVQDAYEFILANFAESNRLWVRMQAPSKDKQKKAKEKERSELRILVGTNLLRLSQLQGVDANEFRDNILPRVLEQVTNCRDVIAQQYLMDCIIQVFNDEFHLVTLPMFLDTCTQLKEKVNVTEILESMMTRLATFAEKNPEQFPSHINIENEDGEDTQVSTFEIFHDCITKLLEVKTNFSVKDILKLQTSLLNYASKCYPGEIDYINTTVRTCSDLIRSKRSKKADDGVTDVIDLIDEDEIEITQALLSVILPPLGLRVLSIESFQPLLECLPWENRKEVCTNFARTIIAQNNALDSPEKVDHLLSVLSPLLRDEKEIEFDEESETINLPPKPPNFEEEQVLVSRLIHLMQNEDTDVLFQFFLTAKNHFVKGGPQRVAYTLQPLLFALLKLVHRVRLLENKIANAKAAKKAVDTQSKTQMVKKTIIEKQIVKRTIKEKVPGKVTKTVTDEDGNEVEETVEDIVEVEKEIEEEVDVEKEIEVEVDAPEAVLDAENQKYAEIKLKYGTRKIFELMHKIIMHLRDHHDVELHMTALKLCLLSAQSTDFCAILAEDCASVKKDKLAYKAIAYEFILQAFQTLEEDISDSKNQIKALTAICGVLTNFQVFEEEDYENFISKTALHSGRLIKKPDQCRMIMICSHLFWVGNESDRFHYHDPRKVSECLQKCVKSADACAQSSLHIPLFVEILNHYIYFFERDCPSITEKQLKALVALIPDKIEEAGGTQDETLQHFRNTLAYIQNKQNDENPEIAAKFSTINIDVSI